MNPTSREYPIIDGFLYNTLLRPNRTNLAMVLKEYESLRKSGAYRTRWLTIPENPSAIAIPAANEYSYQAFVTPGSAYWGWIFVAGNTSLYSIQVTDAATKLPIWNVEASMARVTGSINPGQGKQNLFQKLLIVGQPGILNVSICSLSGAANTGVQLILCGGEPVPEEECSNISLS
jgi:hypothetical protein